MTLSSEQRRLSAPRRLAEEAQAQDYAWAIQNSGWATPDWGALNEQIIKEFGMAGLNRIKRRAWKIIHELPR